MKKTDDMSFVEFVQKLRRIQKLLQPPPPVVTITPVDQHTDSTDPVDIAAAALAAANAIAAVVASTPTPPGLITDAMIADMVFKNAGPEYDILTKNLESQRKITLEEIIERYDQAETKAERRKAEGATAKPPALPPSTSFNLPLLDNSIAAMAAQGASGRQQFSSRGGSYRGRGNFRKNWDNNNRKFVLPVCPPNWNGQGCWHHETPDHEAQHCNALKECQRKYLEYNKIVAQHATQLVGYPHPSSLPAPKKFGQQNPPATGNQYNSKRKACSICGKTDHGTDDCTDLQTLVSAYKKAKGNASANVAENNENVETLNIPKGFFESDDDNSAEPR